MRPCGAGESLRGMEDGVLDPVLSALSFTVARLQADERFVFIQRRVAAALERDRARRRLGNRCHQNYSKPACPTASGRAGSSVCVQEGRSARSGTRIAISAA